MSCFGCSKTTEKGKTNEKGIIKVSMKMFDLYRSLVGMVSGVIILFTSIVVGLLQVCIMASTDICHMGITGILILAEVYVK